jgi:metal-responsive CopG/Arc/MetJ family transcriptional regulator
MARPLRSIPADSCESEKILIQFEPEFLREINMQAKIEHRTRSSLVREAVRQYLERKKVNAQVAAMVAAALESGALNAEKGAK